MACATSFVAQAQTDSTRQKPRRHSDEIQTILNGSARVKFYGALTTKFTDLNSKFGLISGFRLGFMFNKRLGVGLDFNGSIPMLNYDDLFNDRRQVFLQMGYGGFLIEPVVAANKLVHLTFPVSMGAGWAGYISTGRTQGIFDQTNPISQDVFWYVEPAVNVELNLARWLALGIGGGYRIINDLSLLNTNASGLNGFSGNLTMRIGSF